MTTPANSNESYCTFTLALDVTAGGLPSEEEIAKDLESNDTQVRLCVESVLQSTYNPKMPAKYHYTHNLALLNTILLL
jgi:hypothetical protein